MDSRFFYNPENLSAYIAGKIHLDYFYHMQVANNNPSTTFISHMRLPINSILHITQYMFFSFLYLVGSLPFPIVSMEF